MRNSTHASQHPRVDPEVSMFGKLLALILGGGIVAVLIAGMFLFCPRKASGAEIPGHRIGSMPVRTTLEGADYAKTAIPIPPAPVLWFNPLAGPGIRGVALDMNSHIEFVSIAGIRIRTDGKLTRIVQAPVTFDVVDGVRTVVPESEFRNVKEGFGLGRHPVEVRIPLTQDTYFLANYEFTVPFENGAWPCIDEYGNFIATYRLGYPWDHQLTQELFPVNVDGHQFLASVTHRDGAYVEVGISMDSGTYLAFFAGQHAALVRADGLDVPVRFLFYFERQPRLCNEAPGKG
jgi:hypothetical protein